MKEKRTETAKARSLRRRAEERLRQAPPDAAGGPADMQRVIHELQVHHVELEMQNEELRRVQQDLEAARDAAQAADRAKSVFLANMSHEIRTPLSGVVGMLKLLRATPLAESQRHYADLAATSVGQLLCLIDDILDFSKIEAGKLEFESLEFCPGLIVEDVVGSLAPQAQAKGIGLSCRIEDEVPQLVVGDPHRLRQVLVNLVGNAVKFTERGEVAVSVSAAEMPGSRDASTPEAVPGSGDERPGVPASRPPDQDHVQLVFAVRDTGIGIPAERRDRLFQRFSQVDDSTARTFGGTGLGLAISRQLAEQMGGSIRVVSDEGRGSEFSCSIPFKVRRSEAREPAAEEPGGPSTAPTPAGLRILVAEDEPVNREVAVTYLRQRGWQVTAVADGRAALEALQSEPFDLVLMDVQMPEVDGFEATRRIREREGPGGGRMPIIGLTAHALKGDREKCLEAGMDDYLAKPVEPQILCSAVERWASSRPRRRPPQELPAGHPLAFFDTRLSDDQKTRLRSTLRATLTEGLRGLKAALLEEDLSQLAFWAHRLRGALVVFRFTAAARLAEEIETRASASRRREFSALVAALEQEFEQIEALVAGAPSL